MVNASLVMTEKEGLRVMRAPVIPKSPSCLSRSFKRRGNLMGKSCVAKTDALWRALTPMRFGLGVWGGGVVAAFCVALYELIDRGGLANFGGGGVPSKRPINHKAKKAATSPSSLVEKLNV